jgi:hypothetical protein
MVEQNNKGGSMNSRKILSIIAWIGSIIALTGVITLTSLLVMEKNRNSRITRDSEERATLQTTFAQQYGGEATIKQLVSPDKVYAALWTDSSGVTHVSWNIGGLWVTVYSSGNATAP